jgi:hypothetical protein
MATGRSASWWPECDFEAVGEFVPASRAVFRSALLHRITPGRLLYSGLRQETEATGRFNTGHVMWRKRDVMYT